MKTRCLFCGYEVGYSKQTEHTIFHPLVNLDGSITPSLFEDCLWKEVWGQ